MNKTIRKYLSYKSKQYTKYSSVFDMTDADFFRLLINKEGDWRYIFSWLNGVNLEWRNIFIYNFKLKRKDSLIRTNVFPLFYMKYITAKIVDANRKIHGNINEKFGHDLIDVIKEINTNHRLYSSVSKSIKNGDIVGYSK